MVRIFLLGKAILLHGVSYF